MHKVKDYVITKQKENLSFVIKWFELEDIILSEISQTQSGKH
jgi:hypothetical protein